MLVVSDLDERLLVTEYMYRGVHWDLRAKIGWGFVALTKDHPSKISWMKWLQFKKAPYGIEG